MYVFVEIRFDPSHLIASLQKSFSTETRMALMGTIQFTGVLGTVEKALKDAGFTSVVIPQARPLSAGETLGCTSPVLPVCDALVFVADGRFHLEAAMIRNPTIPAYRYDPYSKLLTSEAYDITTMKKVRWDAIEAARSPNATTFGLILGTLGRQGSPSIWSRLRTLLTSRGKIVVPFLMAEINRVKLANVKEVDIWVQVACPRLSIDWGATGGGGEDGSGSGGIVLKPILTPYELEVALGEAEWQSVYPMDFYSNDGGPWANMAHRK